MFFLAASFWGWEKGELYHFDFAAIKQAIMEKRVSSMNAATMPAKVNHMVPINPHGKMRIPHSRFIAALPK